jgi:hypothetical protein
MEPVESEDRFRGDGAIHRERFEAGMLAAAGNPRCGRRER